MFSTHQPTGKRSADRRKELVDMAERLFLERGYDRTAVSDVVGRLGVAQGTFYHYFRSKSEVLNAVVAKVNAALTEQIQEIIERDGADPAAQVDQVLGATLRMARDNEPLIAVIHREENVALHDRLMLDLAALLTQQLAKAIASGKARGRFRVPHPWEAAEALVGALLQLTHAKEAASPERSERVRATLDHLLRAVLGTADHRFDLDRGHAYAEGPSRSPSS